MCPFQLSVLTRRAHRIAAFTERQAALVASLAKTYDLGTSLALDEVNNEIRNRFLWLDALTGPSYPGDDLEQFAKWNLFELDTFSGLRPLAGAFRVGPTIEVESQQQEVVGEHLLPTKAHCTKCSSWCCTDSICSNGLCIPYCMDVECCQCWAERRLAGVCIKCGGGGGGMCSEGLCTVCCEEAGCAVTGCGSDGLCSKRLKQSGQGLTWDLFYDITGPGAGAEAERES